MSSPAPTASARVAIVLLAAWLGASVFFSAVVAPAGFRVLPSPAVAGALVGATLPTLFVAGIVIGIVAAALRFGAPAGVTRLVGVVAGAGTALCCAVGEYLDHRIDALRALVTVPLDSLAPADPVRQAFGHLHLWAVVVLGVAMLFAVLGIVVAARGRPMASSELA